MWIPILVSVSVIAMVLGPILLLRPGPSQRRVARLRQRAAQVGLRVALLPVPARASVADQVGNSMAVYYLPWELSGQNNTAALKTLRRESESWRLVREAFQHEINFCGHWDWSANKKAAALYWPILLQALERLPEGAVALESSAQGLMVYWNERGAEEVVDGLHTTLTGLREQLIAAVNGGESRVDG